LVFDELEQMCVIERANIARRWSSGFSEGASAGEEAHAVDDTRTNVPEGVPGVAPRLQSAPRRRS
jgi:hypothetical protein